MTNFDKCLKVGDYGEALVDQFLRNKGIKIYSPPENESHPADRMCYRDTFFIVETKTKPRMYKEDKNLGPITGFDQKDYNKYIEITKKQNIDVFIFFVDFYEAGILEINVKDIKNYFIDYRAKEPCVMFSVSLLKKRKDLTKEQIIKLFKLDTMPEKNKKYYRPYIERIKNEI